MYVYLYINGIIIKIRDKGGIINEANGAANEFRTTMYIYVTYNNMYIVLYSCKLYKTSAVV